MEEKKKTDPRIVRTRRLLKDAFVELIQEIDIEKLSVNRLAERATINRVTFYLHYRDIPDMLEKMADEMMSNLIEVWKEAKAERNSAEETEKWHVMKSVLHHIADNAAFYKIVFTSKRIPIFRDRLLAFLTERIISRVERKGEESTVHKDIVIWYDSAAYMGTIVAWLQNDMPYTPSYMAKQIYQLRHRELEER